MARFGKTILRKDCGVNRYQPRILNALALGVCQEDAKSLLRVEDAVNQVAFTAANRHDCANAEEILKIMSDVSKQLVKAINLMLNEKKEVK